MRLEGPTAARDVTLGPVLNSRIRMFPGRVLIRSPGLRWVPRVPANSQAPRTRSNGGPSAADTTATEGDSTGVAASATIALATQRNTARNTRLTNDAVSTGIFVIPWERAPIPWGLIPFVELFSTRHILHLSCRADKHKRNHIGGTHEFARSSRRTGRQSRSCGGWRGRLYGTRGHIGPRESRSPYCRLRQR